LTLNVLLSGGPSLIDGQLSAQWARFRTNRNHFSQNRFELSRISTALKAAFRLGAGTRC
jgi:hypothetical protein